MKRLITTLITVFVALVGMTSAVAQSDVHVLDLTQIQRGSGSQEIDVGNTRGGKTRVTTGNIEQQQSGSSNKQNASMGNAVGGQTGVSTGNIKQVQGGVRNTQSANIGNAIDGKTEVTVNQVLQTQNGSFNKQSAEIGNAVGGETAVTLGSLQQTQSGSGNKQDANIGNAKGGKTTVVVGAVQQTQGGTLNKQIVELGNAQGGRTQVTVGEVQQHQSGMLNKQGVAIGNAKGGNATVTIGSVRQFQSGVFNKQFVNIGNTKGGTTVVTVRSVTQTQSGIGGCQQINIGNGNDSVSVGDVINQSENGRIEINSHGRQDDLPCVNVAQSEEQWWDGVGNGSSGGAYWKPSAPDFHTPASQNDAASDRSIGAFIFESILDALNRSSSAAEGYVENFERIRDEVLRRGGILLDNVPDPLRRLARATTALQVIDIAYSVYRVATAEDRIEMFVTEALTQGLNLAIDAAIAIPAGAISAGCGPAAPACFFVIHIPATFLVDTFAVKPLVDAIDTPIADWLSTHVIPGIALSEGRVTAHTDENGETYYQVKEKPKE